MRKRLIIVGGVLLLAALVVITAHYIAGAPTIPVVRVEVLGQDNSGASARAAWSKPVFVGPSTRFFGSMAVRSNAGILLSTNFVVKVEEARLRVLNRGGQRIRVLEVGTQGSKPYEEYSTFTHRLVSPITLEPGASHEILISFERHARRWRGIVVVTRDTPRQKFRNWFSKQSWRRYLPSKWIPDRSGTYIYGSQWQDKPIGQPRGGRPVITRPAVPPVDWKRVADHVNKS